MEKQFYELIRVSTGLLDCLDQGPSPEEWEQLYQLSKQQKVEGICYRGVERLFEFGLRAPQDVSIDWMSETEVIRETNSQAKRLPRLVKCYPEELQELRQSEDDLLNPSEVPTIRQMYSLFLQRQLNMRAVLDYYYVLCQTKGKFETSKGGDWTDHVLGGFGLRRFARALMWLMHESLGFERERMPWSPNEHEGHFLQGELFGKNTRKQRFLHMLRYFKL